MMVGETIKVATRLGDEEVHILQDGEGPQVFLVWHGFDSVNRFYHWDYLRKYGKIVRVGLPGHGPVRNFGWAHYRNWTREHFADVAIAICKRFSDAKTLTLIGHSTGAHVALSAAIRMPDAISRLVLINPLVWPPVGPLVRLVARSPLWRWIAALVFARSTRIKRQSVHSYLEGLRSIVRDTDGFFGNPNTISYAESGHEDYKRTCFAALLSTARICCTSDLREPLRKAQLAMPTLIVHGEEDPVAPVSQSDWLAKHLTLTTLVKFAGVGHLCFAEQEQRFAALVSHWLDSASVPLRLEAAA